MLSFVIYWPLEQVPDLVLVERIRGIDADQVRTLVIRGRSHFGRTSQFSFPGGQADFSLKQHCRSVCVKQKSRMALQVVKVTTYTHTHTHRGIK